MLSWPAETCENCSINQCHPQSWKETKTKTKTLSWSGLEQERLQAAPLGHPEEHGLLQAKREAECHGRVVAGEARRV